MTHRLTTNYTKNYCNLGLPTVPYFPGRPVFRPLCPASRLESSRNARCPVFWPLHSFCFEYVYSYWIPIQSKWVWQQQLVASRSYDEFETYFCVHQTENPLNRMHCFLGQKALQKQCEIRFWVP